VGRADDAEQLSVGVGGDGGGEVAALEAVA
jgi:hypothetical protein